LAVNVTRKVCGVPDVLKTEEKLASLIADSIRPRLVPEIEVVPWRKLNALVIEIYPSNTRPHHLAHLGPDAGVFVRVGSTNRKADPSQIEELKRLNRMDSFDEQAVPDLNSEAAVYTAGFPTPALVAALAGLRERIEGLEFRHWGDADGGRLAHLVVSAGAPRPASFTVSDNGGVGVFGVRAAVDG
jgi:hypothetical protein